jgi:nucleotide-binding universal stress UspA family protein
MSTPSVSEGHGAASGASPFRSIACGVDGTRAGFEAARQAVVLAQPGVPLRFIAVTWETGTRADAMVALGRQRAEDALDRARALAHDLGVLAHCALIDGPHAADKLLDAATGDDLLVVGSSGRSHAGGLVLGHAAADVLRRARTSVLVARGAPDHAFPGPILVAVEDAAHARATGEVAGALARRFATTATILAATRDGASARHAAAEAGAAVAAATGVEPVAIDASGRFHSAAAHVAADLGTALIVTAGAQAERVAESARCSVLLLRPRS